MNAREIVSGEDLFGYLSLFVLLSVINLSLQVFALFLRSLSFQK